MISKTVNVSELEGVALDLLQDNRALTDEEWRAMVSRLISHRLALQV